MFEQEKPGARRMLVAGLSFAMAAALSTACASKSEHVVAAEPRRVRVWLTTSDHSKALSQEADAYFRPGDRLAVTIDVNAARRYQQMLGFGAAITTRRHG